MTPFLETEPWGILVSAAQVSSELKSDFLQSTLATCWKDQPHLLEWHYQVPTGTVPPCLNSNYLEGRVVSSSYAKELFITSLDANERRHKQVASLWQNNQWCKYEIKNITRHKFWREALKLNRIYQSKVTLEKKKNHKWFTVTNGLMRSTDDQAHCISVCSG